MTKIKSDLKCPKCKKKNRISIYDKLSNKDIEKIYSRDIFTFKCKECNELLTIEYPFILESDNYIIYYTPGKSDDIKDDSNNEIKRVCDTYQDLKEKILILEDKLNDIVIEFIKEFLINQLEKDIKKDLQEIRYDGKNEENLIFYLIGINKSIGCTINFYNEILNKSRCKNIKDAILIDKYTYQKYFKMR